MKSLSIDGQDPDCQSAVRFADAAEASKRKAGEYVGTVNLMELRIRQTNAPVSGDGSGTKRRFASSPQRDMSSTRFPFRNASFKRHDEACRLLASPVLRQKEKPC